MEAHVAAKGKNQLVGMDAAHVFRTDNNITRRILELCMKGPVIIPSFPTESRRVLSQICRTWRHLVLSTPSFWRNVFFAPGPFRDSKKLLAMSAQIFERSGIMPLDLDFVGNLRQFLETMRNSTRAEDIVFGRGQLSIMHDIVTPIKHRVRSLKFLVLMEKDIVQLLALEGHSYPLLEVLDVAVPPSLAGRFSESLDFKKKSLRTKGIDTLPYIRQLSLRLLGNFPFHPDDLHHLRWNQLTDLNFGTILVAPHVFAGVMRRTSPSLIRGNFSIMFSRVVHSRVYVPNLSAVVMPSLLHLGLNLHNASEDPKLFNIVRCPTLKSLDIKLFDEFSTTCDMEMFMYMISQSKRTLEKLKIETARPPEPGPTMPFKYYPPYVRPHRQIPIPADAMKGFLGGLQKLRVLFLPHGMLLHPWIIDKMAQNVILPALTELALTVAKDWEQVISMVQVKNEMARQRLSASETSATPQPCLPVHTPQLASVFLSIPRATVLRHEKYLPERLDSLHGVVSWEILPDNATVYRA